MASATADILPECSIHKILSFLSFNEAAKMSVVSKTWLRAWLTHPNLKFSLFLATETKPMDKIMERYRDEKIPIDKFEVSKFFSSYHEIFSLIDKWLDIALLNGVEDIVYESTTYSSLPLPTFRKIMEAKSLSMVSCDLMHVSLSSGETNFNTLRKLSLTCVHLDENMLQALLNSCPLIASFNINNCIGLDLIELRNLQKIKSVSIVTNLRQHVKIQAPSLEYLFYGNDWDDMKLEIVECQNLKSLELSHVRTSHGFLENLISGSQFLESLRLDHVDIIMKERFNICGNQYLRALKIQDCEGIRWIDAPNLVSLEYKGGHIPELEIAKVPSHLKHSKIDLCCSSINLNAAWFCKLGKFLSNSTSWAKVSLCFSKCNKINTKELQLHHGATPHVDVLDVTIEESCKKCPTFVDALLWSCHPRRLNLRSSRTEMITCFMDRLLYRKNSRYSTSHGRNLWYSQLKDVKTCELYWIDEPVELRSGKSAIRDLRKRKDICFLLDW